MLERWNLNSDPIIVSDTMKSVVIGVRLGRGNFALNRKKNYYLRIYQDSDEVGYLNFKANILRACLTSQGIALEKGRLNHHDKYMFATTNSSYLASVAQLSNQELLDQLDTLSFSIWLLDCGGLKKDRGCVTLRLHAKKLNQEDLKYAVEVIQEKFGISAKSFFGKNGYGGLIFSKKEGQKIKTLIIETLGDKMDIVRKKILVLS